MPQADINRSEDDLETLRSLLLSQDRQQLEALQLQLDDLQAQINDPEKRTTDTSDVLVTAMRRRLTADEQLSDTLKPVVVEQFRQTSRDEPDMMAEALFPILGPAIRKMIAAMLTPDKNSKRKSSYRLEQLFLIEKETGLPICHVAADTAVTQDADMVSGMLSAIQSFVQDAFSADEFDGLNTLQVGELSVWIEWGPSAILAAVIRGVGPDKLREAMQLQLEQIHESHGNKLKQYDGNTKPFEDLRPELHTLLHNHDGTLKTKVKNLSPLAKKWLVGTTIALACLLAWLVFQAYDSYRWNHYVNHLDAQPGIVVTTNERNFRQYKINGLRDSLAKDPAILLKDSRLNAKYVIQNFEPYHAIHPDFVLQRAKALLKPPADVKMALEGTTLIIVGGDFHFVAEALRMAPAIAGIDNVSVRD